jgi:hypothetical protein
MTGRSGTVAHHADLERADLERLAGGSLAGALLALWCGLAGWDGLLLATLAGTLSVAVPCLYADRRPAKAAPADRPRRPVVTGPGRVSHA